MLFTVLIPCLLAVSSLPEITATTSVNDSSNGADLVPRMANGTATAEDRNLRYVLNPNCTENFCTDNDKLHFTILDVTTGVESTVASNDTLTTNSDQVNGYAWAVFRNASPAIQAAVFENGRKPDLSVDWEHIFDRSQHRRDQVGHDGAIVFKPLPDYSAAVMIKSLIEVNAANESERIEYNLSNANWTRKELPDEANGTVTASGDRLDVSFKTEKWIFNKGSHRAITAGHINVSLHAYGQEGLGSQLPHLPASQLTNQFDIQLVNISTESAFNKSRFSLKLWIANTGDVGVEPVKRSDMTQDDEYAPGVFNWRALIFPDKSNDTRFQSYLQWRPLAYATRKRESAMSTTVKVRNITKITREGRFGESMLEAFYGDRLDQMARYEMIIDFGDGSYKKNKYLAWTFTLGTGEPVLSETSATVTLVTSLLIAIVFAVCIVAGVIIGYRRYKRANNSSAIAAEANSRYERIN